jgi:hypothetical protein
MGDDEETAAVVDLPREALQKSLESNRSLQAQISGELDRIARLKFSNRRKAAVLSIKEPPRAPPAAAASNAEASPEDQQAWKPIAKSYHQYFEDATSRTKSVPKPNEDAEERKQAVERSFSARSHPPWHKKERERLMDCINPSNEGSDGNNPPDYASLVSKFAQENGRTVEEGRIELRNLLKKEAFSSEEKTRLRRIVDEVREASPDRSVDWMAVTAKEGSGRTVWELFQEHRTNTKKKRPEPWSPEQDELLLKYIAAMGPQFVIDTPALSSIITRFFPEKTYRQVTVRYSNTLLNPKLLHEAWTEEEERNLALYMKVYSEYACRPASFLAGAHLPARSPTSVADKWERSLNPVFSVEPFTKEEDEELLEICRTNITILWKELSDRYFPHRHPHRLMNRWSELATDKDILERCGDQILSQSIGKEVSAQDGANPDEYVVQINKRKRT